MSDLDFIHVINLLSSSEHRSLRLGGSTIVVLVFITDTCLGPNMDDTTRSASENPIPVPKPPANDSFIIEPIEDVGGGFADSGAVGTDCVGLFRTDRAFECS